MPCYGRPLPLPFAAHALCLYVNIVSMSLYSVFTQWVATTDTQTLLIYHICLFYSFFFFLVILPQCVSGGQARPKGPFMRGTTGSKSSAFSSRASRPCCSFMSHPILRVDEKAYWVHKDRKKKKKSAAHRAVLSVKVGEREGLVTNSVLYL